MANTTPTHPTLKPPAPQGPTRPAAPRTLLLAQLSNSVGDGAYYVTSALYFTGVVGLSATQVGAGLAVAWAVGSLAGVPLGTLADRRGPRGVSVLLALATAAAVAAFLVIDSFPAFLAAATLFASAQSGLAAARQALLAGLVAPADRTAVLARLQAVLNAGLAVGAALGGIALHADTRGAYLSVLALDAAGFVLGGVLLARLPAPPVAPGRTVRASGTAVLRDRPYVVLTLLNALMLLRMPVLSLALPLWIVQRTAAPGWTVSALFVLNTAAVTVFQVRAARSVTDLGSASAAVRGAGAVMSASCAVFAVTALPGLGAGAATAVLVAGAVLHVVAEMRHSAGAWQLGLGLAPADRIGQYQGFFGAGVPVARTLGPLVVTTLLIGVGTAGWLLLGAVFALAGAATGPVARWAARTRPADA
ncbi:MFS transporter [Streptomyces sp. R302]|uniref:MFS transporter n=1 Tax=unclassified Streptomyces TaxID=2593676 RepID=UPI00145D4948|nr:MULTISPECIES: MFS transporter [unclassified Streptomyces]NML52682.1 MFS transporter [Streptomyces sp. R301]NML80389.1 MFS transporter [Streptomyces sp. R302]